MKNRIYTCIASMMLLIGAASCDNYLDIQPVGKVIPTTATEFRALLTEAYSTVPNDRGLASFRSDEIRLDATMSEYDLESYRDIWLWKDATASENTSTFSWRQFYHVLFIANYTIEKEHEITDGTTAEIHQLVGESYMLRAYMHFLLANLFADDYLHCNPASTKAVPLKLDSDVENVLKRNTLEEVYAAIVSDLESAEKYLNVDFWETESLRYRFTTRSVDALRSRVMLYMGRWQEARQAAERVLAVNSTLVNPAATLPNQYNSAENIVALEMIMTAQYARPLKVSSDFFALYSTSDLRRASYFKAYSASNITLIKGGSSAYSCTLRNGEMMLNAAEAAARAGDADGAKTWLLRLQQSRYNEQGYAQKQADVEAMADGELLDEILTERARELAFEGHRWFDLRRTTQPRLQRTFKGETYTLEQGDSRYTIRIPTDAIEANPGLAE